MRVHTGLFKSQLAEGFEGFEDLGDLLRALGVFLAELGGEAFRVLAGGGDEFLSGGDLGGEGGGPEEGGGGLFFFRSFRRLGACQVAL